MRLIGGNFDADDRGSNCQLAIDQSRTAGLLSYYDVYLSLPCGNEHPPDKRLRGKVSRDLFGR